MSWESDLETVIASNQTPEGVVNVEFEDTPETLINGYTEYGYGMWAKWLRTGPTYLTTKNPWHGMGRVTTVR